MRWLINMHRDLGRLAWAVWGAVLASVVAVAVVLGNSYVDKRSEERESQERVDWLTCEIAGDRYGRDAYDRCRAELFGD